MRIAIHPNRPMVVDASGRGSSMKMIEARVQKFRNFDDSGNVPIQPDVTALIGKNESGKTAFLQALYHLNPIDSGSFDELDHYPRWLYTKDRKTQDLSTKTPVTAVFEIEPVDLAALDTRFGEGVVTASRVTIKRCYDGTLLLDQDSPPNEGRAIAAVVATPGLPEHMEARLVESGSLESFAIALGELERTPNLTNETGADLKAAVAAVRARMEALLDHDTFHGAVRTAILARLPKFFYFSDYDFIGGRTDLGHLFDTPEDEWTPPERTAVSLLRLAGADNSTILEEDYESRKAELEAVSNDLTAEMAAYWSQSSDLEVVIDVDKETQQLSYGQSAVARYLEIRVKDRRHGHTDNIDRRSNGFRWFFSFLAAFSEYETLDDRIIILLDEPALTLHARAQRDFLRFIYDRLALKQQVVYSTHSPFMVDPRKIGNARLVEDKGHKVGSKVTAHLSEADVDTLFPLQAALAYEIANDLFTTPNHLLVEAPSDYTYLHVLSEHLEMLGRRSLDAGWSLFPAGGVSKVVTFLALLGQEQNVTMLVNGGGKNQVVAELVESGRISNQRFITPSQVTHTKDAAVEDLFTVDEYVKLYNAAMGGTPILPSDLSDFDSVLTGIDSVRGVFDRARPADWLMRYRDEFLAKLSPETLDRFEQLFERINATIEVVAVPE